MLEYALLLSLIAVVAISSVSFLGTASRDTFTEVGERIDDAIACAGINCNGGPPLPPTPPGP
jgi:Flp pilus assembly pilin Flp